MPVSNEAIANFRGAEIFDEAWYLEQYPDVRLLEMDPLEHFLWVGHRMGRKPRADGWHGFMPAPTAAMPHVVGEQQVQKQCPGNSRLRSQSSNPHIHLLESSSLLDPDYYFEQYRDAKKSGLSAAEHYISVGANLGYDPSRRFSTSLYWKAYPDTILVNPLVHYLESGQREGRRYFTVRSRHALRHSKDEDYENWIETAELPTLTENSVQQLRRALGEQIYQPRIAVLMPVYNSPEPFLRRAIESVLAQIYENWQLCIADDRSAEPHVRRVLEEYASQDSRIHLVFRSENGHIGNATNSAMELVDSPWVALLDHDDTLRPHSLAEVVLEINRHPNCQIIYSDEDKIDEHGLRYDPYFKPDFSLDLLRSANYFNHLTVHRAENIRAVGLWDPELVGSQDYDLNLRIVERVHPSQVRHIGKVLYHWRAIEGSTALATGAKPVCFVNAIKALERHVERMRLPAKVIPLEDIGYCRFQYSVPEPAPLVSLIVPTRDRVDLLEACLDSIFEKTTYKNYEVIVLNNESIETKTINYFEKINSRPNVSIIPIEGEYNYSKFHNVAVPLTSGSLIGLINNDVEVISPEWLTEMVSFAAQPRIGCVGAKLYYEDDTIQHAGVILGMGGVAGHAHKFRSRLHNGYFGNLRLVQNLSAVTAACMLFRRHIYDEVGGMDDVNLPVSFNDVDFCLKVRESGYQCVWTPFAELFHHESKTRGYEDTPEKQARAAREVAAIRQRWREKIEWDPFYSRNLSLWDEKSSYMIDA